MADMAENASPNRSSPTNAVAAKLHPLPNAPLEDGDAALARLLQQQERAMLMMHRGDDEGDGGDGDGDDDWEGDESLALARRIQREEEREQRARFLAMAGVRLGEAAAAAAAEAEEEEDDAWRDEDDVNTDAMSYEQLVALGETNGAVSKGAAAHALEAALTVCKLCGVASRGGGGCADEQCAVCRDEFADDQCEVAVLPCGHFFHPECIRPWLMTNRACPLCGVDACEGSAAPARGS